MQNPLQERVEEIEDFVVKTAAHHRTAGGQAAGGTADSVKSTLNGLGGVVGQSGSNSMATQAAKRAMDVNNPNK